MRIYPKQIVPTPPVNAASNYSVKITDYVIDCNGAFTVMLLDSDANNAGKEWVIINSGSGLIMVTTAGGVQLVGNSANAPTIQPLYAGNAMRVFSTGSLYRII